jgi:hypothetical protein
LTIDLSEEEEDLTIFKETTGWMQSWGWNWSFIGLTSWPEGGEQE